MIKVNLLNDRSKTSKKKNPVSADAPETDEGSTIFRDIFGDDQESISKDSQIDIVIKVLVMLSFTAALYAYERVQKSKGQKAIAMKYEEIRKAEDILKKKETETVDLNILKQRFDDEKKHIEAVRAELITRMHFLKGLNSIQTAMVENLWLTSLSYKNGSFKIDGKTFYKNGLDTFYKSLKKVPFFDKTIIMKDSESREQNVEAYEFLILTEIKKDALGGV